jgi:hypothetical protein
VEAIWQCTRKNYGRGILGRSSPANGTEHEGETTLRIKKAAAVATLSGVIAAGGLAAANPANASTVRAPHVAAAQGSAATASYWAHYAWYSDAQSCWDAGFQIYISNPNVINYNCYYVDFAFAWDLELEYA